MKYYKQLDTIRFFAVSMVMFAHWRYDLMQFRPLELGSLGVSMFFVLSGFLIGRILLDCKLANQNSLSANLYTIKSFVIRRCLRIFPIYYLYVFCMYLWGEDILKMDLKEDILYFLTYTSNYLYLFRQQWDGYISHTWSLSVEEQFYLVFPWIVLFARRRQTLIIVLIILFVIGTMFPLIYYRPFIFLHTLSCINAFAIGAIVSYVEIFKPRWSKTFYKAMYFLGLITFIYIFILPFTDINCFPIFKRFFVSIWTSAVICFIINDKKLLFVEQILNFKFFQWVGKISYGVYIYHVITTQLYIVLRRHLSEWNLSIPSAGELSLIWPIQFVMVLILATISWYLIELPLNSLKDRFPYLKQSHLTSNNT